MNAPDGTRTIALEIPTGEEWEAILRGAFAELMLSYNWEEREGGQTADQCVEAFQVSWDSVDYYTDCD
jgi:hypothetical protein